MSCRAVSRAPARPAPPACRARPALPPASCRGLAGHVATLCHDTIQQPIAPAITIQNIVLQYKIFQPSLLLPAIQKLYCNTIFNTYSTCNTLHIAIQNLHNLQYNPFLAIQLGSSLIQISAPVFFFIINKLFSNYFQQLEKLLKNYYYYHYFFLEHSNKFIKNYFTPFSSILQLVKP